MKATFTKSGDWQVEVLGMLICFYKESWGVEMRFMSSRKG